MLARNKANAMARRARCRWVHCAVMLCGGRGKPSYLAILGRLKRSCRGVERIGGHPLSKSSQVLPTKVRMDGRQSASVPCCGVEYGDVDKTATRKYAGMDYGFPEPLSRRSGQGFRFSRSEVSAGASAAALHTPQELGPMRFPDWVVSAGHLDWRLIKHRRVV